MQRLLSQLKNFILVNIWVEKVLIRAVGWFYLFEVFFTIFSKVSGLLDAFLIGIIINNVTLNLGNPTLTFELIKFPALAILILRLFRRLLASKYWVEKYVKRQFAFSNYFERIMLNKLDELNWEHIENPETESKLNRTFNNSMQNMTDLSMIHIDLLSLLFSLTFTIFTLKVPYWVYIVVFVKELPSIIINTYWMKAQFKQGDELQPLYMKLGQILWYFRNFPTLFEIKLTRANNQISKIREGLIEEIKLSKNALNKKIRRTDIAIDIYETIGNVGLYLYFVWQVVMGKILLGTFQYITSAINNLGGAIYDILSQLPRTVQNYRYIKFAYDTLRMQNSVPNGTKKLKSETIRIEFRNVSFKYQNAKRYSLRNVNLVIEDNDRLALVGENGAGKSTFLKLLMQVHYPTEGEILINGINALEYDKYSLYKALSLVTQDFSRFEALTVEDNISITEQKSKVDRKRVVKAAKLADAHDFIMKLKYKYDTILTKTLPEGTELSTGQWQRIAIARSFYTNRPLVILDEPTASIDPIAESKIFSNLYSHLKRKTVIVVSHRYNTVRAAKKILVFRSGQIIEQGTHDELLKMDGYYAKAYHVQHEQKKL